MIEKVMYILRHIYKTIARKNLILLKQEFSPVAFLQHTAKTTPGEWECLYISVDIC